MALPFAINVLSTRPLVAVAAVSLLAIDVVAALVTVAVGPVPACCVFCTIWSALIVENGSVPPEV